MSSKMNTMHSEMPVYTPEERRANIILNLVNIRTYGDVEVKIPLNSVTLINGPSGVGKTSILESIVFLMYNGVANPERFGTKKCWGWLFIGDLIIYRQKDPILFKVWKSNISPGTPATPAIEYTNDEAQRVIDSVYGSMDVFLGCSYLRQKEFSVFLSGTDAEKLQIVKTVATKGNEHDELKEPIKAKVKQLKEYAATTRAHLEMSIGNIQGFDRKYPNLVSYAIPDDPSEIMIKVRSFRQEMDDLDKSFELAVQKEAGLKMLRDQIDSCSRARLSTLQKGGSSNLEELKSELQELELQLQKYSNVSVDIDKLSKAHLFKLWSNEEADYKSRLVSVETEYRNVGENIRKLLKDFPEHVPIEDYLKPNPGRTTFQTKVTELSSKWKEKSELLRNAVSETNALLAQFGIKTLDEAKSQLESISKELESSIDKEKKIRDELEAKRLSHRMVCPSCSAQLVMKDNGKELEKCKDAPAGIGGMFTPSTSASGDKPISTVTYNDLVSVSSTISALTSKKDRLQITIKTVEEKMKIDLNDQTPSNISQLTSLLNRHIDVKMAQDSLLEGYQKIVQNKPEEIKENGADIEAKKILDEKKANLQNRMRARSEAEQAASVYESNIRQYQELTRNIEAAGGASVVDIKSRKQLLQNQIDQLMHLNTASDLMAQRSILEKTMNEKKILAEKSENRLIAANRLLDRANEAERISLDTAVAEINTYLSQILKRLFTNVPISVALSTTKALKSKKGAVSQKFDLELYYNNSKYNSTKQLSGGEKDRLSLALTLAMNKKFGGSVLFLDETLSSLDAELKGETIALLKEFASDCTIVCISHEETEGHYDNVVRVRPHN